MTTELDAAIVAAWIASDEAADAVEAHTVPSHGTADGIDGCDICAALEAAYDEAFRAAARLDREVGS